MTLFIACLLIYHLNLDWWWYLIAAVLWGWRILLLDKIVRNNFANLVTELRK